jgi:polysaccharide biosynthesis/export protein
MHLPYLSYFTKNHTNPTRRRGDGDDLSSAVPRLRFRLVWSHRLHSRSLWFRNPMAFWALTACLFVWMTGCHAIDFYTPSLEPPLPPELEPPRELSKVSLPAYRIEPPDMIRLEVLKLVPRPSYRIEAHDVLEIRAIYVLAQMPIDDPDRGGFYLVEGDGIVTLPPAYGTVRVQGMTTAEAAAAITRALRTFCPYAVVTVRMARSASAQDISRDYAVPPDGVVHLSRFGGVNVTGKTVTEARLAIQDHLAQYFDSPVVGVTVVGYYSKYYYVIAAGLLAGEEIQRFPVTGNETVLDAIGRLTGSSRLSSKTMWLARPAPGDCDHEQILPVDWEAISAGGQTKTNYQILPGDRLYIVDDSLVAMNDYIGMVTNPVSRLLNTSLLGTSTVRSGQTIGRNYNLNRRP